jgi:hypothetical protein
MSRLPAAPAAEKGGRISGDWAHQGRPQRQNPRDCRCGSKPVGVDPHAGQHRRVYHGARMRQPDPRHQGTSGGSLRQAQEATTPMRFAASSNGRKSVPSSRVNPIARSASGMPKRHLKNATSSSAAWAGSRTSAASPRAMTSSRKTSFRPSASLLPSPTGSELIEAGPSRYLRTLPSHSHP